MIGRMDLIRLLKIKKINGDLIGLTDKEEFVISMFDNLKRHNEYYYNQNGIYFMIDVDKGHICYSNNRVGNELRRIFGLENYQIEILICYIFKYYLNMENFIAIGMNVFY